MTDTTQPIATADGAMTDTLQTIATADGPMTDTLQTIATADGPMTVHVFGDDAAPAVLVLMPAPGVNRGLLQYAQRIADAGYQALVPDLYHRLGDGVTFHPPTEQAQMREAMGSLTDAMVVSDVGAVLDALPAQRPVGAVGFCMGGRFVVRTMAAYPERITAGSALHPARLLQDGDDSPHLDLAGIDGPLYVGFGEVDSIVPPEHWTAVREQVQRHGKTAAIDVHPGADHGYALPGPNYQEAAAEASWDGTLEALATLRA
jgi:carboxymethylenebutenolidase